MPGTILLDDLRSSVEDQLHQHVNDVLGAAQQAASAVVQPVQAIGAGVAQAVQAPLIQPPSQEQVLGALQQHVDNITQPVQQAAQAVQQAPQQAMQVLGQPSQPGGALTQLGQTRDQVLGALNQHVDNITQAAQQVPQGLQDLSVPKPPAPEPPAATTALGGDQGLGGSGDAISQPSTAPSSSAPPDRSMGLQDYARAAAQRAGIDPAIFTAQIQQESGFDPKAKSPAGAIGIAQFMPGTAAGMNVDPTDPYAALDAAAQMDAQNLKKYGGDYSKTLAAYNAGGGAVDQYGGVPPYKETQSYVSTILNNAKTAVGNAASAVGGAASSLGTAAQGAAQAVGQKFNDISQFGDKQLSADEAYSACGPAAAVRFAERFGRNPTLREATDLAKQVGWTSGGGMAGIASEQALLKNMGVDTHIVTPDWLAIAKEAQTGNPVTISTPGHYYFADGYNPDTGAFHVGQSGLDLKHGAEWMTPQQMESLMGRAQGALFADNPNVPAKGAAGASLGGAASTQNAPLTMGANQPAQAPLVVPDQQGPTLIQSAQDVLGGAGQAVGGAASALGSAAQGAVQGAQATVTPVLGGVQQAAQGVQTALGGARDAVSSVASDVQQAAQGAVSGAAQGVSGAAQAVAPVLGGAASDLGTTARGAADTAGQTLGSAAASVDQVRQQVQDTINGLPSNATVAQARQAIGDTLDALGPRALEIAGNLPLPMGGTVSDLQAPVRGAQAGLQTIEQQRQEQIATPTDLAGQFQQNVDAARRGDWGAFVRGTAEMAQKGVGSTPLGGAEGDLSQSVSAALTAGGIDPNAARVLGQVANVIGPIALERAIPSVVSAATRGSSAAVTAGLEAIDRLAPPEMASATTRRAGESADAYLARLSDEAAVQRPSAGAAQPPGPRGEPIGTTSSTVAETPRPPAADVTGATGVPGAGGGTTTANAATEMQRNFLRDTVRVPSSDPRPQVQGTVGLPNEKLVYQDNLTHVVPEGTTVLYHETNVPSARTIIDRVESGPRNQSPIFTSDNRDLALGQGGRGVTLEFDPVRANGGVAPQKPGLPFTSATGGGQEYTVSRTLPGAVKAIVVRTQRQADQLATNSRVAARFDFANAQPVEGGGIRILRRETVATSPVAGAPTQAPQVVRAATIAPADRPTQVAPEPTGFRAPEMATEGAAPSALAQQFADHFGSPAAAVREFDSAVAEGRATPTFAERTAIDELRATAPPSAAAEAFTGARAVPGEAVTATTPAARVTARIGEPPLPPREPPITTTGTPPPPPSGGSSSPELDRLNSMFGDKKTSTPSTIGEQKDAALRTLTRMFTDRQVDINQAQERYAKNLGRPLRGDEMAAELQRLASDPAAQVKVDEGLKPAIQSVGSDYPALRNYVTLRSNIEIADNLASRTGNADVGTERLFSGGLNREQSVKAMQDLEAQLGPERFARVQAAADQVTAFNKSLRQRLVEAGVLDEGTAAQLDAQYPNWAKTRILDYMADPAGGQGAGTKIGLSDRQLREYSLKGTERAREDPVASTVAYAHQVERMAMKNEAFQAFLKIDQASDTPMLREVPQSYTPKSNEVTMIGFVDGQKQKYVTDNQALGAAINGAGVMSTPEWTSAWQKIFRSLATSRNPLFLAGNAALDIPTYVLRSAVREGGPQALPRILGELARGYGDAFQGLLQGEFRGENTAAFLKGGGGQSGYFTGGEGQTKRAVAEMQRKNVFQINGSADLGRLAKDLLTLHPVEALGERIELGPRVAAMRLAERRGANPTKAVIDGRTVTVDFSQGGTVTKYLNNFIPFFNVGFQGPAQIARAFRDNPRAFVATAGTLIGMPSAAAEVWNRSDPQRAKDYADVPQYVKDQGVVVMLPGDAPVDAQGNRKPMYALIKLREWMPFATLAREATDRALGDDSRSWQEMASSIGSGLSPIQAQSAAQVGTEPLGGIPILPAAAQLEMNTDFFRGRTIVTQRADQNASAAAKAITPAIQAIVDRAGINAEIRPSAIDFLVRNQGAGVGGAALSASDLAAGQPSDTAGPTGLPGVGGFIGRFAGNQTGNELQQARDNSLSAEARQALRSNGITTTPGPVSSSVNQIPLKIDEETKYQQLANQYIDQAIRRTTASPDFATKTQIGKQSMIDQAVQGARAKAGNEVLNTIPAGEKQRRLKTKSTAPSAA